jgi:glycosyltransferase involved in cell wall biosynthesis
VKPLLTFALFAYNQERFIREAIEGAFSQTYVPLEIILSDDCSSDRTFGIMEQMASDYAGSHRVILNRNKKNLGFGAHINRVMELAKGELIIVAAGDDISLPHRSELFAEVYFNSGRQAKSIFSNVTVIDEFGQSRGLYKNQPEPEEKLSFDWLLYKGCKVLGCSHAWSKDIFDIFGPIPPETIFEDAVLPFRSALLGKISYLHEPLVLYRRHASNASINTRDMRCWQDIVNDMKKYSQGRIAIQESRLTDYRYFKKFANDKTNEYKSGVEYYLYKQLREQIFEHEFIHSNQSRQIAKVLEYFLRNRFKKKTIKYLILSIVPSLYFQYIRLKARRNVLRKVDLS